MTYDCGARQTRRTTMKTTNSQDTLPGKTVVYILRPGRMITCHMLFWASVQQAPDTFGPGGGVEGARPVQRWRHGGAYHAAGYCQHTVGAPKSKGSGGTIKLGCNSHPRAELILRRSALHGGGGGAHNLHPREAGLHPLCI